MFQLTVSVKGIPDTKDYIFEQNIVKVGRLEGNDIILPGGNISRQHFLVTFENGEYFVTDTSSNGAFLNGEMIGRGKKMPLRNHDNISAGDFTVSFEIKRAEEEFQKTTEYLQKKFASLLATPSVEVVYPSFLIVGGPTNGTRVELDKDLEEVFLGRTPDCPIQIPSPTVSKRHARIIKRGNIVEIEDLGSVNGTTINGTIVTGTVALKDRDEIIPGQKGMSDPIRVILSYPPPSSTEQSVKVLKQDVAAAVGAMADAPAGAPATIVEHKEGQPDRPTGAGTVMTPGATSPEAVQTPPPPEPETKPEPQPLPQPQVAQAEEAAAAKPGPAQPPPEEIKTGLGVLEWAIIGAAVLAVVAVVVIVVLFLVK